MAVAGRVFGPEWRRYLDPATEFQVIRLTDPAFASGFSAPWQRHFSRRGELLYWSDREGSRQAFLMNLRTGESRQITQAAALDARSLSFTPDDRAVVFVDGDAVRSAVLASDRVHDLYRIPKGSSCSAVSVSTGGDVFLAECAGNETRIVHIARGGTHTIRKLPFPVDALMARPRHPQLLCRAANRVSLIDSGGGAPRDLHVAAGQTGEAIWVPSGRSIVYLHIPENPKELVTLRENVPDENSDKLIAKTSQFSSVAANLDASVFVGASRSKASPYVLLLVRAVRRELALCEHHASDASMVSPMFSPDSQSVLFASDRDGKPALYRVHVEKFVEETTEDQ